MQFFMINHLDLNKTYRTILDAARNKHFICYGDPAKANDAEWRKVRRKINHHLWELVNIAAERKWPMLSAIVVNKQNVSKRVLDGTASSLSELPKNSGIALTTPKNSSKNIASTPPPTEIESEKKEDDAEENVEIAQCQIKDIIKDDRFLPEEILKSVYSSLVDKKNLILHDPRYWQRGLQDIAKHRIALVVVSAL